MVKVGREFQEALRRAAEELGSQSELARRAGIGKQHISKYIRGDIKKMEKETWEKLAPHVLPFLPSDFLPAGENRSEWGRARALSARPVPLITVAQASGFDCTLESFDSYAAALEHGEAPLIGNREGLIAIQISGDSFCHWFPAGTVVYIGGREYPVPGRRVIAKRKGSGEIVFREFYRNGGRVLLFSPVEGESSEVWEKPNENPFVWIYPVKYSFYDEDSAGCGAEPPWMPHVRRLLCEDARG